MTNQLTDRFVEARGLRLAFAELGPPSAEHSVVLVHGLGSSRHIWDLVAPQLAASNRVLALDQRGHGESDKPDTGYDFPSVVADLDAFLDAVEIAQPILLVGHSWGASVVLHFAAQYPERTAGLVMLDGGTSSPGERMTWEDTLARLTPPDIDGLRWADLRRRMSSRNGLYEDPRIEAVGRSLFYFDAEGRISRRLKVPNHLRILQALWEQRPAELLPTLRCPVLILPARQASDAADMAANKAANAQRAVELQPRARVRWFEDTIHDVPLQRPDELAAELLTFADEVFRSSSVSVVRDVSAQQRQPAADAAGA